MYVCIYVYVYMYVWYIIYLCIYIIFIYVCDIYIYYIYVFVCVCVYIYLYISGCVRVCVCSNEPWEQCAPPGYHHNSFAVGNSCTWADVHIARSCQNLCGDNQAKYTCPPCLCMLWITYDHKKLKLRKFFKGSGCRFCPLTRLNNQCG